MNILQRRAAVEFATGKKVKEVSAQEGCHWTTFHRVLNGVIKKSPLYDRIAEITGYPKHKLWPTKFKEQ